MDKITLSIIADLLINMAAGWFSLVFIVPPFSKRSTKRKLVFLTGDLLAGILSLLLADAIRRI